MGEHATLPDLLRRAAAVRAGHVALHVDGGASLTYDAWQRRSGALARGLRRRGVQAGDRVGVRVDAARWPEHAVACLAVQKAAAVAVPLHPGLEGIELRRVLADAGASAVLAPADLPAADAAVEVHELAELEAAGADDPLDSAPDPGALAEILYATEPFARPRGRRRAHAELAAGPWRAGAVGAAAASMVHAFPPGTRAGQDAMAAALHPSPVRVVALPTFDPARLCAVVASEPEPVMALHPATARALLDSDARSRHDVAGAVRLVVLASGRVDPELLVRLDAAFPGAQLLAVDVLGAVFRHDRARPGALGRAVGDTVVEVTGENGKRLEPGEVGRLRLDGEPTGSSGYTDADGFLYQVTGRHEVVRGPRATVCRAELEATLRAQPGVTDAAVVGVPDDDAAEQLVAAVVAEPAHDGAGLRRLVVDRLGEEKAPDRVAILDALPRNGAGLLRRPTLRHRLGAAADNVEPAQADGGSSAEPRSANEQAVLAAWRRVLGRRDIGVRDDFFEFGGGWGDAAAVTALVEDATGAAVAPAAFADAPTVAGLAAAVERAHPSPASSDPHDDATETVAPVAGSQQGMLWHEHFAPGCQNLPGLARRFRGPLDVAALERVLDEIVRRHGALRTTFALRGGRLVQVVAPYRGRHLPVSDLTHLSADEQQDEVERLATEAGHRPFDLVTEELFTPALLRLADDDHVLLLRTHHSVFDDWSVGVFRGELASLYSAYTRGQASPLPDPAVQFADFSRNRAARMAGPAGARELAFWRRELAGAPVVSQLPIDDPDRPEGSPQPSGEPVSVTVPAEVHGQLRALAQRERATVFMATLAAFAVLVQRYTGQNDLVLATVVANRNRTEHEHLIGCFTKKVPLRLRLGGDPTFTEALSRTREALLGALTRQDLPFEDIVQATLGPPAAAHGLVPHLALMFQGVTTPQGLSLPGVDSEGLGTSARARRTHFMADDEEAEQQEPAGQEEAAAPPWGGGLYLNTFLILSVDESDDGLTCSARGAFHAPAARDLLEAYRVLVADAAAAPSRRVSELAVLDDEGRAAALTRGRGPEAPPPAPTLLDAFATQVARHSHAIAVRDPAEEVTYAALDARADHLAQRLRTAGVDAGHGVGLALPAGVDAVVAALATWKAGATVVGLDPDDDATRLGRVLDDARVTAVVMGDAPGRLSRDVPVVPPQTDGDDLRAATRSPAAVEPDDAAVAFHGSGRSALASGVVLDHRAVANLLVGLRTDVHRWPDGTGPARRVCLSSAPTEDGFLRQLVAVLDGHTLVVPDRAETDPAAPIDLLASGEVDLVECAPGEMTASCDAGLTDRITDRPAHSPEPALVIAGRERVTPEQWAALRGLAGVRGHVLYGPPACAFAATARAVADSPGRPIVGRPLANVSAQVLDAHDQPVPARAIGELHLGGASLASRGIDPQPEPLLAATTPHERERPLWATGHRARRLPDGHLELLGGHHTDTDLGGVRVDPERVSAALARSPGVRGVSVTIERDEHATPCMVASVLAHPDASPTLADLRGVLWARLPGYAWPSRLSVDDTVPGSAEQPSGDELPDEPLGGAGRPQLFASALAALWAERLGVNTLEASQSYWQNFSFLPALSDSRNAGLPVAGTAVTRTRTVEALATALAARGMR